MFKLRPTAWTFSRETAMIKEAGQWKHLSRLHGGEENDAL